MNISTNQLAKLIVRSRAFKIKSLRAAFIICQCYESRRKFTIENTQFQERNWNCKKTSNPAAVGILCSKVFEFSPRRYQISGLRQLTGRRKMRRRLAPGTCRRYAPGPELLNPTKNIFTQFRINNSSSLGVHIKRLLGRRDVTLDRIRTGIWRSFGRITCSGGMKCVENFGPLICMCITSTGTRFCARTMDICLNGLKTFGMTYLWHIDRRLF